MGFLDRLRADHSNLPKEWNELTNIEQLKELETLSFTQPVIIFKHSTSCGISAGARYRLENEWNFDESELAFYYLDLLRHRDVSNEIADRYNVIHQSPQLIVLSHGKAVNNTSHHQISRQWLAQAVEAAA